MGDVAQRVDVVVVGLGVGGEEVAGKLAEAGLTVVGIESNLVGGECPYWGCIPSKMMIRGANALEEARRVAKLAGSATVHPDWTPIAKRIREEATDDWDDTVAVERFVGKGGRFVRGYAALTGPNTVAVGDEEFEATRGIVLATGAAPVAPPIEGLAGTPYWTNREAIEVEQLPVSLVVLGGGAIGVELAQVFARFGVRVTVVEAADHLLPFDEPEAADLVRAALEADGVTVRTGMHATRVLYTEADGFAVEIGGGAGSVTGDRLLVATGRRGRLADLGLETIGLDASARAIETDERMRAADGIWAVGDVAGHGAFTHMAMYEAGIAIRDILGQEGPPADYRAVPRVTFTDPEVGTVGLTEAEARDRGMNVRVGQTDLTTSSRGWIHKEGNAGLIKLIADGDLLVGATSVGPMGGEVLSMLTLAVHARVPLPQLRSMIYAYPTFHRAVEDALRNLG
ncbi:Pyruvate/2-oxoglutarate dehydrogenase complex, dihydrolipoamide dehydrogenase (E3) component [Asanoa hainanensis]|uniref:Pyruvate/2-oxoglutarate dehydrogenase complex, dihydrolipoamide dehydrogenase (E3) component n=1 Tax=Asanoa hainanensis TaxID=560556 RepID=A0A239MR42_9ACTN|nr:NAD(P)/FAD-dependent oxidoreductase [Asanoa hainanensis]SNT44950.1 Pyruvate/2-oxoglutarate dehydrogenase complex, dihydrolipoamide dehydrogenase (E3) component [Asanoa hainanensis]